LEVDLSKQEITQSFSCSSFNHFTGHGCFSAEGNYLFTSESNFKTGAGKIVVRDSRDFQILTEYDSQGIGPHEIKLMPDGKTLAIANGGILTHPDSGRKKLNLDSMQSSLNYMDIVTGKTLASYQVAEPKASIRHIDISPQGSVAIAMQLQREACRHNNIIPLCAYHQGEDQIQLLQAAKPLLNQFNDYVGSTTINANNHIAGFTSPRGDIAAFWSLKTGQIKGFHQLHDVCGLAISHDSEYFILSNSHGEVRYLDSETLVENRQLRKVYPDTSWDNHLLTLRA
jgi:hypothetical protein